MRKILYDWWAGSSEEFPEYPGADVTTDQVVYSSSTDPAITTLKATVVYPTSGTNLPVKLVIHGYHETAADVDNGANANFTRWARLGYLVVGVEMRGSNGSSGSFDDGGREVMDCYDALQYAITTYSAIISLNRYSVLGFSHGGAITYLLACRYPDLFQDVTVFFGISDHGVDATFGWYQQEPGRQATLSTAIGGTPAAVPDNYGARYSKSAIATNYMGFISIFHDDQDTSVDVSHSRRVVDEYDSALRTDYYYNESTTSSLDRWLHQYPSASNDIHDAEPLWKTNAKTKPVNTVPASGTLKILGLINTKSFIVNMNDGDFLNAGRSRFGTLVYNMANNTFEVTNDSDNYAVVSIYRKDNGHVATGVLAAAETYVFTPTTIVVDGDTPIMWFDAGSKVLLSGSDITAITDKTGGPQYQGYALTHTGNRPALLSTDINSLPALEFVSASTEGLVGGRRRDLQNIGAFTFISVGTGTIIDHGQSSSVQTQFDVLSGGTTYFYAINNGSAANGSDAGTATYLVRSTIFDGSQGTNATRLVRRENKIAQTVSFSGTIPATTENNSASVFGIGKRSYSANFFGGKSAEFMIFNSALADVGDKEDILKAKYVI